jgi:uncharacterized peroxidase-related enzyme
VVDAVLDDHRSADIEPPLSAMLDFLVKLTESPEAIGGADIQTLRAAGITDEQIEDASVVCAAFNAITRIADALEFAIPEDGYGRSAATLLRRGYL